MKLRYVDKLRSFQPMIYFFCVDNGFLQVFFKFVCLGLEPNLMSFSANQLQLQGSIPYYGS